MNYKDQYQFWLEDDYFDAKTKEELKAIANDEKEIEDHFYRELEFGTGGLRGVIGAGTNRMNLYTVRKATQGLANYILKWVHRIRESLLHTIHVLCPLNLQMKQHFVWLQTELRHMYLMR